MAAAPLYGLVLAGGRSRRMGADKAALAYHGKPQVDHVLDLLAPRCERTFVSCREDQGGLPELAGKPRIHDAFFDMGPLGGILSALQAHREAAWLVVACDLPFLDGPTLDALIAGRDPLLAATAFEGEQEGLPEPVCALYEPMAFEQFLALTAEGIRCPRKALIRSSIRLLPPRIRALRNVNLPEEYRQALAALAGGRTPAV